MTAPAPFSALKAVIFDMDGVLVNSEPCHEQAFLKVVEEIGFAGKHGLHFSDYVGRSDKELWADFTSRNQPGQSPEQLLAMKSSRVIEVLRRERPLFPGVGALVRALAARFILGLASGSERSIVDEVLRLDGLAAFFQTSVSGSDVDEGKPNPEIFLRAADLLGVEASECCVIEDSKPGIAAGLAAGMRVIAIANTHPREELHGAHHIVRRYEEIADMLLPVAILP